MITEAELAELEHLATAATPGPWVKHVKHFADGTKWERLETEDGALLWDMSEQDVDFAAAARTAVPKLTGEVRRLQAIEVAARRIQQADPYHPAVNVDSMSICDAMDGLYKLLDAKEATS